MPELSGVPLVLIYLRMRLQMLRRDERGAHTLEVVIAAVVLAGAAVVVTKNLFDRSVSTSEQTPKAPALTQPGGAGSATP